MIHDLFSTLWDRLQGAIDGFQAGRAARRQVDQQQQAWNQTVVNASDQLHGRRIYLERENDGLRAMLNDMARMHLRTVKGIRTNDGSYPTDHQLGFDGYGTSLSLVSAEVSLQKHLGKPKWPAGSWRERLAAKQAKEASIKTLVETADQAVLDFNKEPGSVDLLIFDEASDIRPLS